MSCTRNYICFQPDGTPLVSFVPMTDEWRDLLEQSGYNPRDSSTYSDALDYFGITNIEGRTAEEVNSAIESVRYDL